MNNDAMIDTMQDL